MAAFDEFDVAPRERWCGDTQGGIWNPTQGGGCDPTRFLSLAPDGRDARMVPGLFEVRGSAALEWRQRIEQPAPGLWRLRFDSHPTSAADHHRAHGRYTAFLMPWMRRVYLRKALGAPFTALDLPQDGVVRELLSADVILWANEARDVAFGLAHANMPAWAVQPNWFAVIVGQSRELINWSVDLSDALSFFSGSIGECLQIATSL